MADTMTPQTPPRKLFKPSSKTKTPTPGRRMSASSTRSTRSTATTTTTAAATPSAPRGTSKPPSTQKPSPEESQSAQSGVSQSSGSLRKPALDDIAKSTTLAPLTGASDAASGKLADFAGSDTTDDTPTGLIDHDVLTPTDTVSRSTDAPGSPSRNPSDALGGRTSSFKDRISRARENSKKSPESAGSAVGNLTDKTSDTKDNPQQSTDSSQSIADQPKEALENSTTNVPETPSTVTDGISSPTEIAKFFADQGNTEMSNFISALTGKDPHEIAEAAQDAADSSKQDSTDRADEANTGTADKANKEHIGKEMSNFISALTEKDPQEVTEAVRDAVNSGEQDATDATGKSNIEQKDEATKGPQSFANKTPDLANPAEVSKRADRASNDTEDSVSGAAPTNNMGEPNTSDVSKEAQVGVTDAKNKAEKAKGPASDAKQNTTEAGSGDTDDTQVADNMGEPAHIERRIEIPLPRPEKVVHSPPVPDKPDTGKIANGMGDVKDLSSTDKLRSTDDLPDIPEDDAEDPPEEVLNPSVHSASANISPIPKVSKISPIGMPPPPHLSRLAHGLGGNKVDDVGNIVDDSGKVLGHATGDLPAMVGKEVSNNGEVYGESGEVIGYVSENFTGPPPPTEIPGDVLGGLKVDHEGNILDSNGNAIGRFHQKPGENGSVPPFNHTPRNDDTEKEEPKEEEKPKINAHTGGSPSDIFLDVKSTTDGIQLTIRIPTTFQKQPQNS